MPQIRPATSQDLVHMLAIYAYARDFMKSTGNPQQWGDTWPSQAKIEEDIARGASWLLCEGEKILGVAALCQGIEPTYAYIEGAWPNDMPYLCIHRIAAAEGAKGVFAAFVEYCKARYQNIRIDTHTDNAIMQKCILQHGFSYCGIVYMEDNTPRLAYQWQAVDSLAKSL